MAAAEDIFQAETRSAGDLAGVFEYDGTVGYFYLYDLTGAEEHKILDQVQVLRGAVAINTDDVSVKWDREETKVGLFLHGVLCAMFDTGTGRRFAGASHIPSEDLLRF